MIRRPPRSTPLYSSAASDVYKRQLLLQYLCNQPWILLPCLDLLKHPPHSRLHQLHKELHLMVCPVSGEPSAATSFQKKLPMCSWPLGGQARRNSTEPILTNGWGFERKIAYYSPLLNEALQFLVRLFNQGLSYSALNTARSALSAIIITEGGESVSYTHLTLPTNREV